MLYDRFKIENLEDQGLAPYGVRSKNSRGRLYPEDEADYRSCFQRDRDRVLHTTFGMGTVIATSGCATVGKSDRFA